MMGRIIKLSVTVIETLAMFASYNAHMLFRLFHQQLYTFNQAPSYSPISTTVKVLPEGKFALIYIIPN